jgi:hypothetical protein
VLAGTSAATLVETRVQDELVARAGVAVVVVAVVVATRGFEAKT